MLLANEIIKVLWHVYDMVNMSSFVCETRRHVGSSGMDTSHSPVAVQNGCGKPSDSDLLAERHRVMVLQPKMSCPRWQSEDSWWWRGNVARIKVPSEMLSGPGNSSSISSDQ